MMKKRHILIGIALTLVASGCGKDRTVDEYQAQKDNQEQRQTSQSIVGTFNGVVTSKLNGKPIGALTVTVSGDTEISQPTSTLQNVITANITLTTKAFSHMITASSGIYNIYSHAYQIDFTIPNGQADPTGKSREVKFRLAGKLDPATKVMDGSLQCVDYAKYGGKFRLTRDGNSPQLEDTRLPTERAAAAFEKTFAVTQTILGSPTRVTMHLSTTTRSPEQDFLDLFYPVRFATVTVVLTDTTYGDEILMIPFENSEWDMDSKTLTGSMSGVAGTGGTQPYHYTIQCTENGTEETSGWNCAWSGSTAFNFNAKAGR